MNKVLTRDGTIKIGAYKIPERKKPCLCIQNDNKIVVYGYFQSEHSANEFMDKLADFVNAERKGKKNENAYNYALYICNIIYYLYNLCCNLFPQTVNFMVVYIAVLHLRFG